MGMKFALTAVGSILILCGSFQAFSQTLQVDAEEVKRLVGEVADLREANVALQRNIAQMRTKTEELEEALRTSNERSIEKLGSMATREDLTNFVGRLRELDEKREADRKLILEQFEKLATSLTPPSESLSPKMPRKKPELDPSAKPIEGNFLTYKVESGDMLEKVLKAYNENLTQDGRPRVSIEQIQAANPKLNPNNLIAGSKILLPVPDKK